MPSIVCRPAPASSEEALVHFEASFRFETDCWDVHHALSNERQDFVILDVRSADQYQAAHVPNAVNLPRHKISEATLEAYDPETVFIVYCAGPHCNGADRAAIVLAKLGRPVKKMIGGLLGWQDEGFACANHHSG